MVFRILKYNNNNINIIDYTYIVSEMFSPQSSLLDWKIYISQIFYPCGFLFLILTDFLMFKPVHSPVGFPFR